MRDGVVTVDGNAKGLLISYEHELVTNSFFLFLDWIKVTLNDSTESKESPPNFA